MGRTRVEEFWCYVEDVDGGLKCKFCCQIFKGKPSISRIKFHLSGEPGRGVQVCEMVPDHVKEKACEANKRRKTMPNSSGNEVPNPSSSQQNEQVGIVLSERTEFQNSTANNIAEIVQLVESQGEELLTKELLGQESIRILGEIFSWLVDDRVSSIGIYGMGGVGKTELAKHLNNKLLKTPNSFNNIYWVSMPFDFNIHKLQDAIANVLNLDLSGVDDEHRRAAKLSKALNNSKKFILFLDDVWDYIPVAKVGVPVDGCKWILTTRSLDVCLKMDCQRKIKLNPLSEQEGWLLFLKELGNRTTLSEEIKGIAESIATKCEGLPLGIEVMARNMKGVDGIHGWRDALDELEEAIPRKENLELFGKLKLSYDNLDTSSLQQCFLCCGFLSYEVGTRRLIEHLIDEEIIQGERRQAAFDKGHTMLDRLEKVGLLEINVKPGGKYVSMHGLTRSMAIQIIKSNGGVMVKVDAGLEKIPDCEEWTEDLVKVSLIDNKIKEIPTKLSPRCPKLSTLLLSENSLINISNSFFEQLNGLKVLDLSDTFIEELPSSISDLESLNVLLLSSCRELHRVPSLSKLKALKKLDLKNCCEVENLPQGIEFLSNLRHLDLRGMNIWEFPVGILPGLLNLQVLMVRCYLKGEELAFLRKLEILICRLDNVAELKTLPSNLNCYTLQVGVLDWDQVKEYMDDYDDEDEDEINRSDRKLSIVKTSETEHFLSLSFSFPSLFQSIQCIYINCLEEENAAAALPLSLPDSTFSRLKVFVMHDCSPSIKKLFPPGLVSNFQNLEELSIGDCKEMEEIIATEEEHQSHNSIQFTLPKLKRFALDELPNLKSICRGDIICNSLERMTIGRCEKLSRVPLSLLAPSQCSPLPSLKSFFVSPREWWERVELVHPNTKDILSPFCRSDDLGVLFSRWRASSND